MSFPVEGNSKKLKGSEISKAAVDCWFTTEGKTMPRFSKLKGAEEELITIRNIRILKEEQKLYAGIPAKKHWYEAEHNGVLMLFFSGVLSGGL